MSRHPFAVPFITIGVLLAVTGVGVWLYQQSGEEDSGAYVVIVSHDKTEQIVPSRAPTVGELLKRLNIKLNQGDVVEPGLEAHINSDEFRINVYRAQPVEVVDGSKRTIALSAATTPRSIVSQAGVSVYAEDELTDVTVANSARPSISKVINIRRSVPVRLILYGTPTVVRSHSDTVGEMLKEKRITLREGDRVQPSADTPVTANMQVFVLREGTQIVTETKVTPAPVKTINDPKLTTGTNVVRQEGSPGTVLLTFQVDKKTKAKIPLQSVVVQPAVTRIVARGTAPVPVSSNLATWLRKLRMCESGGNYRINTGNGYYGAYQFSLPTWQANGYSGYPHQAPPSVQDAAIVKNTNRSGGGLATQNPGCWRSTGISAFPPGS